MAKFCVPFVVDNPDGWGPTDEPEHLSNVPYAPFSKSEKLGKIADFTQQNYQKGHGRHQHAQGPLVFNFLSDSQEESFHLVDNKPVKPSGHRPATGSVRRSQQQPRTRREDWREAPRNNQQQSRRQYVMPGQKQNWNYRRDPPKQTMVYTSSIEVKQEWTELAVFESSVLNKLEPMSPPNPTDLYLCGILEYCDRSFDLVNPRNEKPIPSTKRVFRDITTSDDPIMRKFAAEDAARVFITDTILTAIMCAAKSVYSWDVVITKVGDKLFFDKRDQSTLSDHTINETAPDQVPEEKDNINGVQQLTAEATRANHNFSQQVLKRGQTCKLRNPNPFKPDDSSRELASVGYKYRKWSLEDEVDVLVRCEVNAVQESPNRPQLVSLKALVEFCSKQATHMDWRQKLEMQRGAVFATELKNNSNKIAKWTAAALLANVDVIKLGYVSRVSPKDNRRHALLGLHVHKPKEFANQIGLKIGNCWAVFLKVVQVCMDREDGKYLLLKDPNRPTMRLYEMQDESL